MWTRFDLCPSSAQHHSTSAEQRGGRSIPVPTRALQGWSQLGHGVCTCLGQAWRVMISLGFVPQQKCPKTHVFA